MDWGMKGGKMESGAEEVLGSIWGGETVVSQSI